MSDIKSPVDATGKEIPLDTTVLYAKDGDEICVDGFSYENTLNANTEECEPTRHWIAFRYNSYGQRVVWTNLQYAYLDPPDSWEKLLEDLDRLENRAGVPLYACTYFNQSSYCRECPAEGADCNNKMFRDIADRIRNLRGGENND